MIIVPFMDYNQLLKFDVEILVADDPEYTKDVHAMSIEIDSNFNIETIHEKRTKSDVVLKVIFL